METGPKLSFVCPMSWDDLKGDGSSRFCGECGLQVTNLSALPKHEREALLLKARTERVCVMYLEKLSRELVTPENSKVRKAVQYGAAALAAGAMVMAGGCRKTPQIPHEMSVEICTVGMIEALPDPVTNIEANASGPTNRAVEIGGEVYILPTQEDAK